MLAKAGKFLIVIVLILGVFFRFANLDQKVYSADEVRSILRLSGSTSPEFIEQVFTGDIVSVEDIQHYQRIAPDRNLADALNALAGTAAHPPLYPLLTRFWMQIFNAPIAARVFSILLSLLALPCLYWWCLELFESPLTGWVAIALVAISPFHIMAAQNTTQYSLWTVAIALSSAALLKALRVKTQSAWFLYAATLAMGFYTHLFFAFVALSQGIYVFLNERLRFTQNSIAYLGASLAGFFAFSPWLFIIFTTLDKIEESVRYYRQFSNNPKQIFDKFIDNSGNTFIDFYHSTPLDKSLDYLLILLVLYAFYILIRHTPIKVWSFLVLLAVVTALSQIVPDLITSSIRSLQARYYLPCFLAIELAVAYLLSRQMGLIVNWQQNLGKFLLVLLLCGGIFSGVGIAQTQDWALDDQRGTASSENLKLAPVINAAAKPLVISEATHSFVLALSYLVKPEVRFQLLQDKDVEQWQKKVDLKRDSEQFSDLFLYLPDPQFLEFIGRERNFESQPVVEDTLYKLVQK
jgi:uncharacterized membrane protein